MSFFRHEEIYHCGEGAIPQNHALAHRNDESPAGYSLAGCSPAEPASASPASASMGGFISIDKNFAANGKLSLISLSQLRGAVGRCPRFPQVDKNVTNFVTRFHDTHGNQTHPEVTPHNPIPLD